MNFFLDSGAHGLYSRKVIKKRHEDGYKWYDTNEFLQYLDSYAEFITQHQIEVYANVDIIFDPERTWKAQQYLESKGVIPLPVIHFGTDLKWLKMYLDRGYKYIALGGLGQEVNQSQYAGWADAAFAMICDQPGNIPRCKVHGFAITAHALMMRYPWYSVDSATWVKVAGFGTVIYPAFRNGDWCYKTPFNMMDVSTRYQQVSQNSPGLKDNIHLTRKKYIKDNFLAYIASKGFVLGVSAEDGAVIIEGLCNSYKQRQMINSMYFDDFAKTVPAWPWPFFLQERKGLLL